MENLYHMFFTTSLFILAIILLRVCVRKKTSMRLQYALWLLVAVKLLVFPVPQMESVLSIQQLPEKWESRQQKPQGKNMTETDSGNEAVSQNKEDTVSVNKEGNKKSQTKAHTDSIKNTDAAKITTKNTAQEDSAKNTAYKICTGVAKAGSIFFLLYFLVGNIRFAVYLHKRRIFFRQNILPVPVYLVEKLPSPCLYGKAVYLTPEMAEDETKCLHMLTHEYCHYRQGDLFWSVLRCICVIIYWWNPLVWYAAYLSKQDCELACDEAALKCLGEEERISYGRTLLSLVAKKTEPKDYFLVTTTMTGGGNNMKQRITKIAQKNKSAVSVCIIAVLFAGLFLFSVSTVKPSGKQTRLQSVKQSTVGEGDFKNIFQKAAELTLESVTFDTKMAQAKNNFSVSAEFKDGKIVLSDVGENTELVSIEEKYDEGSLFVSMMDENNGYALYCSTPACGLMEKLLYETNDRWKTYRETDIGSQVDGYPTSISVLPDGQIYIGAQMRSNGYLFTSADSGKTWNPVIIGDSQQYCRYGFAPVLDREKGITCVLLECSGFYSLYQSDVKHSSWELAGTFTLESEYEAKTYFIHEGAVVIEDSQGKQYRIINNVPASEEKESAVHDLDEAVGKAVLSYNADGYGPLECVAEGHILLEAAEGEDHLTTVYALTMYGEYGFENGGFIKGSGSGVIPAVITFSYDEDKGYVLKDYRYPKDGGYYLTSIHEMFPQKYWDRCINIKESDINELTKQEQNYAEKYLMQIGRNAKIGEYEYDENNYPLLTDAGVSVEVSNYLGELEKLNSYPYWTGSREKIEDGVRYLYTTKLDKNEEIIYTKRVYDTGEIVEQFCFDMNTGREIKRTDVPE